jgi:hypothetical protein
VVEHFERDVDLAQFWPTLVRIISGIALNATAAMTTK